MEIVIPYSQINNSQTITSILTSHGSTVERWESEIMYEWLRQSFWSKFKERGLDMSRHEVVKLENDPDKQVRVLTIRPKTYII